MRTTSHAPYLVLSAPQQVAAAIKRDILEGALKPGERLPGEEQLAKLFGVSRPTLRAGLQELCAAQILVVQRGRNGGYRVGDFSLNVLETSVTEFISLSLVVETLEPAQFLEVRFALELLVAETAALKRSDASLAKLDHVAAEIRAASDDPRSAFDLDLHFHRLLANATENPLIVTFEGAMIAVLHRLLGDGSSIPPNRSLGNVGEIVESVRARNPAAAREAMERHLSHAAVFYGIQVNIPLQPEGKIQKDQSLAIASIE